MRSVGDTCIGNAQQGLPPLVAESCCGKYTVLVDVFRHGTVKKLSNEPGAALVDGAA